MESLIVRLSVVTTDNTVRTMCEKMMSEDGAWACYQDFAKILTDEVKVKPLVVRPAGEVPSRTSQRAARRSFWLRVGLTCAIGMFGMILLGIVDMAAYHNGWKAGYVKGMLDAKVSNGTR